MLDTRPISIYPGPFPGVCPGSFPLVLEGLAVPPWAEVSVVPEGLAVQPGVEVAALAVQLGVAVVALVARYEVEVSVAALAVRPGVEVVHVEYQAAADSPFEAAPAPAIESASAWPRP